MMDGLNAGAAPAPVASPPSSRIPDRACGALVSWRDSCKDIRGCSRYWFLEGLLASYRYAETRAKERGSSPFSAHRSGRQVVASPGSRLRLLVVLFVRSRWDEATSRPWPALLRRATGLPRRDV